MQIEIDLTKLERGTHKGRVKVTRGGKTFWRDQRVGMKEEEKIKTTVGFQDVLDRAQKFIDEGINIRSTIMKESGKYVVHIMGRYMEGEGVGSIGSQSLLEIHYKDRTKAELISEKINKLKPKKRVVSKKENLPESQQAEQILIQQSIEKGTHNGYVKGNTYHTLSGDKIKFGDYVRMEFMGTPTNMELPLKLVSAKNYYSNVGYNNNVELIVKDRNDVKYTFKESHIYSPKSI